MAESFGFEAERIPGPRQCLALGRALGTEPPHYWATDWLFSGLGSALFRHAVRGKLCPSLGSFVDVLQCDVSGAVERLSHGQWMLCWTMCHAFR